MANTIVVELTPKDAAMVSAWQRQKEKIAAFATEIEAAGHKTHKAGDEAEAWTDKLKSGLGESAMKVAKFVAGFGLIEKAAEKVVESFDKWIEDLDEVVKKEREA